MSSERAFEIQRIDHVVLRVQDLVAVWVSAKVQAQGSHSVAKPASQALGPRAQGA